MRFGRKLALQVTADNSGAPYLSHKAMKEAINKTVRELRLYQSTVQTLEGLRTGSALPTGEAVSVQDVLEIEGRIYALDQELFRLVEEDLMRIFAHVRLCETRLEWSLADLQAQAMEIGILVEEQQLEDIRKALPMESLSSSALCQRLIQLRFRADPGQAARELGNLIELYSAFVEQVDEHTQYLEINVAGFRKLLKRHEKQIPHKFHACPTPFLQFHRLVTRTSRQLAAVSRTFGAVLADAREQLVQVLYTDGRCFSMEDPVLAALLRERPSELPAPKGLGPECEMVLEIQRRLQDPAAAVLLQAAGQAGTEGAPAGLLYPKPGTLPGNLGETAVQRGVPEKALNSLAGVAVGERGHIQVAHFHGAVAMPVHGAPSFAPFFAVESPFHFQPATLVASA